ncbi:MAG: hypothetical protein WDW38_005934 [Sanguina aurantia]
MLLLTRVCEVGSPGNQAPVHLGSNPTQDLGNSSSSSAVDAESDIEAARVAKRAMTVASMNVRIAAAKRACEIQEAAQKASQQAQRLAEEEREDAALANMLAGYEQREAAAALSGSNSPLPHTATPILASAAAPKTAPSALEVELTQEVGSLRARGLTNDVFHAELGSQLQIAQASNLALTSQLATVNAQVVALHHSLALVCEPVTAKQQKASAAAAMAKKTASQIAMEAVAAEAAEKVRLIDERFQLSLDRVTGSLLVNGSETQQLELANLLIAEEDKRAAADAAVPGNVVAMKNNAIAAHAVLQANRKLDGNTLSQQQQQLNLQQQQLNQQQQRFQQQQLHQRQQEQANAASDKRQQQEQDMEVHLAARASLNSAQADARAQHEANYRTAYSAHVAAGMTPAAAAAHQETEMPSQPQRDGSYLHAAITPHPAGRGGKASTSTGSTAWQQQQQGSRQGKRR